MVDAADSKSVTARCGSSSLPGGIMHKTVYLDWNSYGITHPTVLNKICQTNFANSASKHFLGQQNQYKLRTLTRALLSHLTNVPHNTCELTPHYYVTYVSNATEANFTTLNAYSEVFVSDVEHPSVRNCPHATIIPVDQDGQLDLAYLEDKIQGAAAPFLVSYMLANHETGIINDLKPAFDLTKKYGGHFHTDAVQAFGRIELMDYFQNIEPDYITIAPYKTGGIIGVAALIHKYELKFGWSTKRNGTIPLPLIEGFIHTLELPKSDNKFFEDRLNPKIEIIGKSRNRLPNTTCIVCDKKDELMMILDMNKICISTGAACTTGTADKAHSVNAMGREVDTIRISSGWSTTEDDFARCAEIVNKFL